MGEGREERWDESRNLSSPYHLESGIGTQISNCEDIRLSIEAPGATQVIGHLGLGKRQLLGLLLDDRPRP